MKKNIQTRHKRNTNEQNNKYTKDVYVCDEQRRASFPTFDAIMYFISIRTKACKCDPTADINIE